MIEIDQLHATERGSGFQYPAAFWSAVEQLQAVSEEPGFANTFRDMRTAMAQDVENARDLGLDKSFVPFMCEQQPAHMDYYCVGCDEPTIVVFAVHTTVGEWPDITAFIEWARQRCKL